MSPLPNFGRINRRLTRGDSSRLVTIKSVGERRALPPIASLDSLASPPMELTRFHGRTTNRTLQFDPPFEPPRPVYCPRRSGFAVDRSPRPRPGGSAVIDRGRDRQGAARREC